MIDLRTEARLPVALVLPIIDECDGRCTMCGIWQRPPRLPLEPERLATILAEPLLSAALTHINVTGGEPVNHPRFAEIASVLSQSCPSLVEINVNTSGLVADRTIGGVAGFRGALDPRIAMVATISLDGVGGLHDRVRGVRGAFAETARAVDGCLSLARRGGLRAHLNCTVSRANCRGVGDVIAWARDRGIGLTLTLAAANDLYLANQAQQSRFAMSSSECADLASLLDSLQGDDGFPMTERNYYEMLSGMLRGGDRTCSCTYQTQGVFLDLDGVLYACGTAGSLPYGRLPEETFGDIYLGERGDAVRQEMLRNHCPSCPTNSYHGLADGVWLKVLKRKRAER